MPIPDEYRFLSPRLTIDPGFVHHRSLEAMLGATVMQQVDAQIKNLPLTIPGWLLPTRIDHIYTRHALEYCRQLSAPTLEAFVRGSRRVGTVFCSTDTYGPCPNFYDEGRVQIRWQSDLDALPLVHLEFDTAKVRADTLKSRIHRGSPLAVIGRCQAIQSNIITMEPLVIGFPWLSSANGDTKLDEILPWMASTFYEHHLEDIDEFAKSKDVPVPSSPDKMQFISEASFKRCLAKILGDVAPKDWGGERSDYFSAHVHLKSQRVSAAFLLKGPAHFRPMEMTHLGAKADQLYRLSQEPADLLVLQHCHDVLPVVRAHLRAFAVNICNPRRYCVIDGRDSLRLLQAYGLLEEAQDRKHA